MTTENTINFIRTQGDGSATEFIFNFKIFDQTDIKVYKEDENGDLTLNYLINDYTVSFDTYTEMGMVTFTIAPLETEYAIIVRDTPKTQLSELPLGSNMPQTVIETGLDKLTTITQDLSYGVERSIKAPVGSSVDYTLPAGNANKSLVWNDDGTALVNSSRNFENDIVTTIITVFKTKQYLNIVKRKVVYVDSSTIKLSAGAVIHRKQDGRGCSIWISPIDTNIYLDQTGETGLDTGVIEPNTWYYVFNITNSIDEEAAEGYYRTMASKSYNNPTLPEGYERYCYVGSFKTDSNGDVVPFLQEGNNFYFDTFFTPLNDGKATTWTDIDFTDYVPPISKKVHFAMMCRADTSGGGVRIRPYGFSGNGILISYLWATYLPCQNDVNLSYPLNDMKFQYKAETSGVSITCNLYGYEDTNINTSFEAI